MESNRYTVCKAPVRKTIAATRKRKTIIDDNWMEDEVPTVGPPTPICCIFKVCHKHVEEEKRADEEVKMIVEASLLCQETMPEA